MVKVKDIVIKLKKVKEEKGLSYNDIQKLMEKNGDYISKSTLCRVFAKGSENQGFRYEITIRPIAKALLDIENIEDDDNMDIQAMKSLLKYKMQRIEELEALIEKEKFHYLEKLEAETDKFQKSLTFLKEQLAFKDQRIDHLLDSNDKLIDANHKLLEQLTACPCRDER